MSHQMRVVRCQRMASMMDARRLRARGREYRDFVVAARFWNRQLVRMARGLPQQAAA